MSYEGLMNLYLGETPKTTNPDVWNDMQEVYRAIHLLNAGFGEYSKSKGSGGPEKDPWDAMPFERWFYSTAAESISAGSIVTAVNFSGPSKDNGQVIYKGIVRGAPIYAGSYYSLRSNNGTFPNDSMGSGLIGVALDSCSIGDLCKVGVGPAIIKVEGIKAGDTIMAYKFASAQGGGVPGLHVEKSSLRGPVSKSFIPHGGMVVGYGVAKDSVMILPFLDYAANSAAYSGWNTPTFTPGPTSEA